MASQLKIAVVILDWNKSDLTHHCLRLARATTGCNPKFIIVDNASVPPTPAPPEATLIRNNCNLGFAGGVNTGIRHALENGVDYVWLLNNDAEPLPATLEALVAAMLVDPAIGLASPVILNSDAGDSIDWHGSRVQAGIYETTDSPIVYKAWQQINPASIVVTGTALLLSRAMLECIGIFDERLFAYWEDTDISLRAAAAGFRAVVVPHAAVRHASGTDELDAAQRRPYYFYFMARNELLVLAKARVSLRARYWAFRRLLRWRRKPGLTSGQRRAILLGLRDGVLGRGGPSPV